MPAVDPPICQIPVSVQNDSDWRSWFDYNFRFLYDLWDRTGAGVDLVETNKDNIATLTTQVSLNTAKLNLITVTSAVDLDTLFDTTTAVYTPTNAATDRSWDANAAVTGTGIDVADAGPADVALLSDHDALVAVVQELSDVVATLVADLQAKGVLG